MDFEKIENLVDQFFLFQKRKEYLLTQPTTTEISKDNKLEVHALNIHNALFPNKKKSKIKK